MTDAKYAQTEVSSLNKLQSERLMSLIEYAQQSARLRLNSTTDIVNHKIFSKFEHELSGLPGVDVNYGDSNEEIWLLIKRLNETAPPTPENEQLLVWLDLSRHTNKEPALKPFITLETSTAKIGESLETDLNTSTEQVFFVDYQDKDVVKKLYDEYVDKKWKSWSSEEKKRRQAIKLYADFFTIKQQLEGAITDTQIELVWGMGIGLWKLDNNTIKYPLLTQEIEIVLNKDFSIEVRPRQSAELLFELDIYASVDNLGVSDLQKAYDRLTEEQALMFSPFDRNSYEPQLKLAVTHLDPKGKYWRDHTTEEDRQLPPIDDTLKVTDTWVIFARSRNKNLFIQDLESFKKRFDDENGIDATSVIKQFVDAPSTEHEEVILPSFRGISSSTHESVSTKALFFPLPFNEEQVHIIQTLEHSNGVIVQGPPGTGKTHTIANIIAHYMAIGKRVLVTSMKESALLVLKEKLPISIQPLVISLLTNEQDGMKQFEFTISKIAKELQVINRQVLKQEIDSTERNVDQLHACLASIDRSVSDWAKKNIQPILIDGTHIHPENAAKELVASNNEFEWFQESISVEDKFIPQFDNTDIVHLREARQRLKNDLVYIDKILPQINDLPKIDKMLSIHEELIEMLGIKTDVQNGVFLKISITAENFTEVEHALTLLLALEKVNKKLAESQVQWLFKIEELFDNQSSSGIGKAFKGLLNEVNEIYIERNEFLERPISLPNELCLTAEIIEAIGNKARGRHAFGVSGIFIKRGLIKKIDEILILDKAADATADWEYVHKYVLICQKIDRFIMRWNAFSDEVAIFSVLDMSHSNALRIAKQESDLCMLFKGRVDLIASLEKCLSALSLWHSKDLFDIENKPLNKLIKSIEASIKYYHLGRASIEKNNELAAMLQYDGRVCELIRECFSRDVGNPARDTLNVQKDLQELYDELNRILKLKPLLDDVEAITTLIYNSGAINWAKKLKYEIASGVVDDLLPDNWQEIWRLRRLANYFQSINSFGEFRKLMSQRGDIEKQLVKAYQDIIAKRTWLQMINNATPDIKAALQAFQAAISKIGKGTGKRAIRYRKDARNAVSRTNKAIPCWIMPHYRISESLPAEFGCFDLVIIDEASQSDLTALPAILRAKKILIVGDDKQVSPDGIGLEEGKISTLMRQFLSNQVEIYRQAMSPERSIYDLCKIVFANSQIMLREHFRSVAPIIEYSKREFYNHELKPLRLPIKSERLEPPLIDVLVEDGFRDKKENIGEAKFIVDEIKKICDDPNMQNRSIGVVSLLGNEQARTIWEMLQQEITPDKITKHKIACGDALTFQGKERDIMFLSMVVTRDENTANSSRSTEQRYNVAASRARDRMYLVRSVELDDLSTKDKLRRSLIEHFASPFVQNEEQSKKLRELCESGFEYEVYDLLVERGYQVKPQVRVGNFRIDMVVEGHNDMRLAIECDGDSYHDASKWDDDMNRQRILERAGWKFWRCFASTFVMYRNQVIQDLINTLTAQNIEPIGSDETCVSIHCEHRRVKSTCVIEQA